MKAFKNYQFDKKIYEREQRNLHQDLSMDTVKL